jgi:DNA topoisomerase-1
MKLFIVESPKKCGTIKKFLGGEYIVKASVGHVRKIPEKALNIDLKNNYTPTFEVSSDKKDVVKELKSAAKSADEIILAMDPDPEGEAIAWHLYDLFDASCKKKCTRITYTEITKKAVTEALKNKREIDMDLVDAQRARQVLDRLIGYKISPVLWYKAKINKSSAGRVQSVALKIVSERHKEIEAFKPEDYWFLTAKLKNDKGEFDAKVVTKEKDNRYKDEKIAKEDLDKLKKAEYTVDKIEKKEKKNKAFPPFDTNSMQGACGGVFGWSLSKSKTLAQSLYEQGLVTYIRTDSFSISDEAMGNVRGLIKKASPDYLPTKPNIYKKKANASAKEAHECIRPTDVYNKGDSIDDPDAKKMYKLIRDRFIASQMKPQIVDTVTYHVKTDTDHTLIANGQTVKFDGWTKVYKYTKTKEELLPETSEGEVLELKDIKKTKHTTKPPARYNEVSLAKKMEELGVGRPSTRTGIITAIQKKGYVEKESGKKGLIATPFGLQIYEYLEPNFKDFFMDVKYTSALEEDLDKIENGDKSYLDVVDSTYKTMQKYIGEADGKEKEPPKSTGEKCQKCKEGEIVEKTSRFGPFFSCNKYPDCTTIYIKGEDGKFSVKVKKKLKKLGTCEKCGKGNIVEREGKNGKPPWYACDAFPKCRTTFNKNDDGTFEVKQKKNWKKKSS